MKGFLTKVSNWNWLTGIAKRSVLDNAGHLHQHLCSFKTFCYSKKIKLPWNLKIWHIITTVLKSHVSSYLRCTSENPATTKMKLLVAIVKVSIISNIKTLSFQHSSLLDLHEIFNWTWSLAIWDVSFYVCVFVCVMLNFLTR